MRRRLLLPAAVAALLALAWPASAEVVQEGGVKVSFAAQIAPTRLPRDGAAPVRVAVSTTIAAARGRRLPQLRAIRIAINRHGRLDPTGLPVCRVEQIQPATSAKALQACRGSLLGRGRFSASVALTNQGTYPSRGKLLAFNGIYKGQPAILAHVYGTEPIPTSVTLPFRISHARGTFATVLTAVLPRADNNYVTGLDMTLERSFSYRGQRHSFAAAGCPAPRGFPGAVFPFARASFEFAGGRTLASTLTRSCRVG